MKKFHTNAFMHVKDVTLLVKNIEVMLDFYQNKLGFFLHKQEKDTSYLGTKKEVLLKLVSNPGALPKGKTTGLYHYAILLPNREYLGQMLYHLLTTGVALTGASDHGVSEALYLDDPEGNGIEIYVDKDDSLWKDASGNIHMITEMMDAHSVIEARDPSPFKFLPEETIMGHLHLHVKDIKEASVFFNEKLGFQSTLDYYGSALFISDQMYHHHMGLNIWNGRNANDRLENQVGLLSYTLWVPENKIDNLGNVDIEVIDGKQTTKDVNGTLIVFETK